MSWLEWSVSGVLLFLVQIYFYLFIYDGFTISKLL